MINTFPSIEKSFKIASPARISDGPNRLFPGLITGKSEEFLVLKSSADEAAEHFGRPYSRLSEEPSTRFYTRYFEWKTAVKYLSDVDEIVGMGENALPFIFAELRSEPDNWFYALRLITLSDPVPEEHRGNIELMAKDWLAWAARHGFD
jgi:hypothetical protein